MLSPNKITVKKNFLTQADKAHIEYKLPNLCFQKPKCTAMLKRTFLTLGKKCKYKYFLRYNMYTNTDELQTLTLIANQHFYKFLSLY